ncbi:internal head protein [Salmonella phage SPLA1a]|nr:internal head protein [Salmonella phage SPLA1a]
MANFVKSKLARESVEGAGTVVPDGIELPAESVEGTLADIEHDTKPIDQLDAEADVLAEDGDETDAQLDAVDAAEAAADGEGEDGEEPMEVEEDMPDEAAEQLDVAQESIRKRWAFDHRVSVAQESYGARKRRQVARESLWDDIKAFLQRIFDWLKEQGRKIKDRWLKFSNQGKSIQARAKKYDAALRGLGKQKKDTVSGGFIKNLTTGGKFVGDDINVLKGVLSTIGSIYGEQEAVVKDATRMVSSVEGGKLNSGFAAAVNKATAGKAGEVQLLGNQIGKADVKVNGDDLEASFTVIDAEGSVEKSVSTPSAQTLSSLVAFFNQLGKAVEENVKAYHKNNQAQESYERAIEALLKRIDGVKIDDNAELTSNVRVARRAITVANQYISWTERCVATGQKNLIAGVNGYISAGIAAYEKSK